jgi:hypothetical protein
LSSSLSLESDESDESLLAGFAAFLAGGAAAFLVAAGLASPDEEDESESEEESEEDSTGFSFLPALPVGWGWRGWIWWIRRWVELSLVGGGMGLRWGLDVME